MFQNSTQVAGVRSLEEARLLEDLKVSFVGFPLKLGYHKPDIDHDTARAIIREMRDPTRAVLITYLDTAEDSAALCKFLGVSIVQLHAEIAPEQVQLLKQLMPALRIIKSLIVRPEYTGNFSPLLEHARAYEPWVDAFITDTFDSVTTATGATGKVHDWRISKGLAATLSKSLILAGGLSPTNVFDAISAVHPAGVDSHTGVEDSGGWKSPLLVARFVEEAARAFGATNP
jgi:Phosphoribosylanthranilate isomerase